MEFILLKIKWDRAHCENDKSDHISNTHIYWSIVWAISLGMHYRDLCLVGLNFHTWFCASIVPNTVLIKLSRLKNLLYHFDQFSSHTPQQPVPCWNLNHVMGHRKVVLDNLGFISSKTVQKMGLLHRKIKRIPPLCWNLLTCHRSQQVVMECWNTQICHDQKMCQINWNGAVVHFVLFSPATLCFFFSANLATKQTR